MNNTSIKVETSHQQAEGIEAVLAKSRTREVDQVLQVMKSMAHLQMIHQMLEVAHGTTV